MKKSNKKVKLSKYLKKYSWQIILYLFLFVVSTVIDVFIPIMAAEAVELVTLGQTRDAIISFIILAVAAVASMIVAALLDFLYNKYSTKMIKAISLDCAMQAFKLDSPTYASHPTGNCTQRIISDPGRIINRLASLVGFISGCVSTVFVLCYVIAMNWIIGLCVILLILIVSVIEYFRSKNRNKNFKKNLKLNDRIVSITNEVIKSEKDIKTSGLEGKLSQIIDKRYDDYFKQTIKTANQNLYFRIGRNFLTNISMYGILILGIFLMEKSLIAMSTFMLIYSYRGQMVGIAMYFSSLLDIFSDIKISLGRINELFDEKEYITEKFGVKTLENVQGNIKFKNVSFAYREYNYDRNKKTGDVNITLKNEMPVFKKLNFEIEPNTTVAFVGKSGSGKSTIVGLASKLLLADKGKVLIDNVDIKDLTKETLRNSISLVNQFPYIFDMSIKDNLLLAKEDATDDEIEDAIEESFLKEFVDTLPNGVDTVVGESGVKLSGGQRQRLAIARALLRKSSIIIFDESTSSLDNFAQEHIKKCIDGLKGKSTIIIVAHRLSTIRNVDNIFFLDKGKIVDQGTFDELYKNNQEFKEMFMVENIQDKMDE